MPQHPWRGKTPDEPVPTVDAGDMKAVWQIYRETEEQHPGFAIGFEAFKGVCNPGTDVHAVSYRAMMLRLLFHIVQQRPQETESQALAKFKNADELDDRLFEAMARKSEGPDSP